MEKCPFNRIIWDVVFELFPYWASGLRMPQDELLAQDGNRSAS